MHYELRKNEGPANYVAVNDERGFPLTFDAREDAEAYIAENDTELFVAQVAEDGSTHVFTETEEGEK